MELLAHMRFKSCSLDLDLPGCGRKNDCCDGDMVVKLELLDQSIVMLEKVAAIRWNYVLPYE